MSHEGERAETASDAEGEQPDSATGMTAISVEEFAEAWHQQMCAMVHQGAMFCDDNGHYQFSFNTPTDIFQITISRKLNNVIEFPKKKPATLPPRI